LAQGAKEGLDFENIPRLFIFAIKPLIRQFFQYKISVIKV